MTRRDEVLVATFYRLLPIVDPALWRDRLERLASERKLLGTVLVAPEGVNATIAGQAGDVRAFVDAVGVWLEPRPLDRGAPSLRVTESRARSAPFGRLRVRLRSEVVTFGQDTAAGDAPVGVPVEPEDWNRLLERGDVLLLDTRNDYEIEAGTFEGALDPGIAEFGEFPEFVERSLPGSEGRPIAMFCTGGIRCEKASRYLLSKGFERVYQLAGGILAYLDRMPRSESRFQGDCFVFDRRVTVDHELRPGRAVLCPGCGWPLAPEVEACHHCGGALEAWKETGRGSSRSGRPG